MVQTNYDHWLPDEIEDDRRTQAEDLMRSLPMEDAITPLGLYIVLGSADVHNDGTIYTAIMNPRTGYIKAIGQNGIVST